MTLLIGECAERWQLYAEVQEKCKGVAARLKGACRDLCFHAWASTVLKVTTTSLVQLTYTTLVQLTTDVCCPAWSSTVLKDRRARARFANSTLYMSLSSWKGLVREEKRQREVLGNIRMVQSKSTYVIHSQTHWHADTLTY